MYEKGRLNEELQVYYALSVEYQLTYKTLLEWHKSAKTTQEKEWITITLQRVYEAWQKQLTNYRELQENYLNGHREKMVTLY